MKIIEDAFKDNLGPIKALLELAGCSDSETRFKDSTTPAIDAMAICKQVETIAEAIRAALIAKANAEYIELKKLKPDLTMYDVLGGEAVISKLSPRSTWIYSPAVVSLEANLQSMKKLEQESQAAKKITPKDNPEYVVMFAISLKQTASPVAPEAK